MPEYFSDSLLAAISKKRAPCVVGLDTTIESMPKDFLSKAKLNEKSTREEKAQAIVTYNKMVIDQIADIIPAVKPNCAFYERFGAAGYVALEETISYSKKNGLLVILDGKRGDIGSTSEAYARAYLTRSGDSPCEQCDALTVNPFLGEDAIEPFLKVCGESGAGIFLLVKTSNKGSATFQDLEINGEPLYLRAAKIVDRYAQQTKGKSGYSGIGAVVGATWPEHAKTLRGVMPNSLLLVPGYGAQGGSLDAVTACFNADKQGAIVNSSRGVIFPHLSQPSDLPIEKLVRQAAEKFAKDIREGVGM